MTVLVTGANGHIGNNLVRILLDRGEDVRVIHHRSDQAIQGLAAERVRADLLDPASLVEACRGIDLVYHLAAHISIVRYDADRLHAVNVAGARNLVEAALKSSVRRLVFTSSIEALMHPGKGDPIDEQGPPQPDKLGTLYGRTKALAELEVLEGVRRGLDAVIVHPTAVVGPYDFRPSLFGQAFIDFAHQKLTAFTPGGFDLVDVRDVVEGILAAAQKGRSGERYLLSGSYVRLETLAEILESCTHVRRPLLTVPLWLAAPVGVLMPAYYRLSKKRPRFTSMSLKLLADGRRVDHTKAAKELGYAPRPPREGVQAAVQWFRETGRIHPVFRSKKDPGIILAVAVILLVCGIGGLHLVIAGRGNQLLLGAVVLLLSVLYAWLTLPVIYELEHSQLLVRGGPFRWKIPFESILDVHPSKNPISAPAWSFKRLRVNYEKRGKATFVLISPRDRERFLRELVQAAPGLERSGARLVRKGGEKEPGAQPS